MADVKRKITTFPAVQFVLALALAVLVISQAQFTLFIVTHDHDGAWSWSPLFRVLMGLALVMTSLALVWWVYSTFVPNERFPRPAAFDALGVLILAVLGSLATHVFVAITGII